tara:strand:- start:1462 stop:1656 length:195 start_codon:yes stop_codon:yes gene_type:complete
MKVGDLVRYKKIYALLKAFEGAGIITKTKGAGCHLGCEVLWCGEGSMDPVFAWPIELEVLNESR